MKELLIALLKGHKKSDLTKGKTKGFKRKIIGRDIARDLLRRVRRDGVDQVALTLEAALADANERNALFGFEATRATVGTAMIAMLERFGSRASARKKCKKKSGHCKLSMEREESLLVQLNDIPQASTLGGVGEIRQFLDDYTTRTTK